MTVICPASFHDTAPGLASASRLESEGPAVKRKGQAGCLANISRKVAGEGGGNGVG